jgi:putative DNA primase/helicase
VIPDKSYGFGRRIIVLNFDRRFSPEEIAAKKAEINGDMKDYIIEEINGVFRWAVDGLRLLLKHSGFRIPEEVQKSTADMMETLNPLLIFVTEMCEIHEQASVGTVELWEAYAEWCNSGHNRPLGRNRFLDQIRQTFPKVHKKRDDKSDSRIRMLSGITLTNQARDWVEERKTRFSRKRED